MIKEVIKRDGRRVPFDVGKIERAIMSAAEASGGTNKKLAKQLAFDVCDLLDEKFKERKRPPKVDDIQNCIEKVLIEAGHAKTAKEFILYRAERNRIREAQSDLMKTIGELTEMDSKDLDNKRENANINADTAMGAMLKFGSESAKAYNLANLITKEYSEAHKNGDIHIHDLDFLSLTETCVTGDMLVKIKIGDFSTVCNNTVVDVYKDLTNTEAVNGWVDCSDKKYYIESRDGNYTQIMKVKANNIPRDDCLYMVETPMGILKATGMHRVPVCREGKRVIVYVKDIDTLTDYLYYVEGNEEITVDITEKQRLTSNDVVYDFETADHYFTANGFVVHNCCQIDLTKLFTNGFSTGHGYLREPNDIKSYAALACIAIQSNQNDQHGGQSVPKFDYDMAKGISKSFITEFGRNLGLYLQFEYDIDEEELQKTVELVKDTIKTFAEEHDWKLLNNKVAIIKLLENTLLTSNKHVAPISNSALDKIFDTVLVQVDKETHQAMEALVANLNTMQCIPEGQKIWVIKKSNNKVILEDIAIEDLYKDFETNKYEVITVNEKTGKVEIKPVIAAVEKGESSDVYELTTLTDDKVRTTESHEIMTLENGKIKGLYPTSIKNVLQIKSLEKGIGRITEQDVINKLKNDATITQTLTCYSNSIKSVEKINGTFKVYDISVKDNENFLTAEGIFVHNCRAGAQVPFSSINLGTDTSAEGRMVTKNLLLAMEEGLGNGETPIFPIVIFKVKDGVNYEEGTPNHDLLELSLRVTAKRMFPNFSFIDSSFNKPYYKEGRPDTEIAYMGCRTRVISNVYDKDKEIVTGRGNLSFTSINLPRLAIESKGSISEFYDKLDAMIDLVIGQLLERFKIQCRKHVYNYPFLMGQGVWIDSDKLKYTDSVESVLKHGTLSVGFIGLAEALVALIGKHHGESEEAQKLGLDIVSHMRQRMDKASDEYHLNFSLLATPAEGLSGRFIRIDKKKYGIIPGVTDRDYYTNSMHVPVYYPIGIADKLAIEGQYHKLTNAGHISYVEVDGDVANNVEALMQIVECMHDSDIGYGSINHPVDRDPLCGFVGVIGDVCPRCGRHDGEGLTLEQVNELKKKYPSVVSLIEKYNK